MRALVFGPLGLSSLTVLDDDDPMDNDSNASPWKAKRALKVPTAGEDEKETRIASPLLDTAFIGLEEK